MASNQTAEALRKISMLTDLPPWQLEVVAEAVEPIEADKGIVIVERGSDDGYTYFLREGQVTLEAADGGNKAIELTPETARNPVANLRPRIFGVRAMGPVRGIRVPDIVLSAAGCNGRLRDPDDIQVESQEGEGSVFRFRLPVQPVAARQRKASSRSSCGTRPSVIRPSPMRSSTAWCTTPIESRSKASRCEISRRKS